MTLNEKQEIIIQKFSRLEEWMDKYEYLIQVGQTLPPMDNALKIETNAVSGCQSKVWIASEVKAGKIVFYAESDTLITKGLIGILLQILNEQSVEEVAQADLYFISRIGLNSNLSPSRANGLGSIVNQMKRLALAATPQ